MNRIIIGLSSPIKETIFSKIIRVGESIFSNKKVNFSHVYIQFYSKNTGRYLIFQTNRRGANFIEKNRFLSHNIIKKEYSIPMNEYNRNKCLAFCMDYAGSDYGFKSILGMAYVRIMKFLFNKKVKNPFSDGLKTSVCSELTSYALNASDADFLDGYDWEYYGPAKIDEILNELASNGVIEAI
jgi:hypothetical protein